MVQIKTGARHTVLAYSQHQTQIQSHTCNNHVAWPIRQQSDKGTAEHGSSIGRTLDKAAVRLNTAGHKRSVCSTARTRMHERVCEDGGAVCHAVACIHCSLNILQDLQGAGKRGHGEAGVS